MFYFSKVRKKSNIFVSVCVEFLFLFFFFHFNVLLVCRSRVSINCWTLFLRKYFKILFGLCLEEIF